MISIWQQIVNQLDKGNTFALCTIVSSRGSSPLHPGAKMIVFEDGSIKGSIGGGKLEYAVIQQALKVIKEKKAILTKHDLKSQYQMCCGGQVEIFIEPIMKNKKLYLFGAGHINRSVAFFASQLDFDLFVFDERENILNQWHLEDVHKVPGKFKELLPSLPFDNNTFIVIATHEHALDREVLAFCIKKPFAYLGMIGSKNKIATTRKMFLEGGICTEEDLNKVDMPIGLDIGAESAQEIAISIVAGLIKTKNQ